MSIPAGMTKFVLTWSLPGGEKAQCAWWEAGHVAADVDDAQIALMAASASFTTWLTGIKPLWNAQSSLVGLDGYFYNGGTAAANHGHADLAVVGTGTGSHPNMVCCVLTLRTATASRRGRGRMYLPGIGILTQTTGLHDSTKVDTAVTSTAAYFSTRNDITGGVVVVSQTGGTSALVTSVSADYVPDTQRRRVNKMVSTRKTAAVT